MKPESPFTDGRGVNLLNSSLKYIGVFWHLQDFGLGKMDIKYLVLHLSVAAFMLYLTVKVLELTKSR